MRIAHFDPEERDTGRRKQKGLAQPLIHASSQVLKESDRKIDRDE